MNTFEQIRIKLDTAAEEEKEEVKTTTQVVPPKPEGEKKKKKKKKKTTPAQLLTEPTRVVRDDGIDYPYNYGKIVDVKGVDLKKPWNEATLDKYLSDAGFARASDTSEATKTKLLPVYIKFCNKLMFEMLDLIPNPNQKAQTYVAKGNLDADYFCCYNPMCTIPFEITNKHMVPAYVTMATMLVVGGYTMGLPGFGRDRIADIIKERLVRLNRSIPRRTPDLTAKIMHTYNRYFGIVDEQLPIVWDLSKLTWYLENNTIRKYRPTKYKLNVKTMTTLTLITEMVVCDIMDQNRSQYHEKDLLLMSDIHSQKTPEKALDVMGSFAIRHWDVKKQWAQDMRQNVLLITLLAFELGVKNYCHLPLITTCLKRQILLDLEFDNYNYDVIDHAFAYLYLNLKRHDDI
ncbi:hypothetical protein DFA_08446 [Cavenderia fasciculata]|uniref:Uncharacterized protein n=1 Tax=Cavenderia fasciculata TaxID=261658 RepID=F4Q677_CACFS|nr:uncharacterized protein DFA_08446 [Cavenderia fasciculata]EGG17451.1 hypothetical protein DFA_08446 [Cavenderia fasciculata]|eukprot:XP_004355935.1 hypothetical protein DFA_08446 [Cavenderia fasciculata]